MKSRKNPNPFSPGRLNRLIDDLVHPFFNTNKGFIFVDGILHGLVEQNPALSVNKFVRYNLPELMKSKKNQRKTVGERRRSYNCTLPVNSRYMFCNHKKAGSWCLKAGAWRVKCPNLVISYKRARW
jgi:hypothetical protein